jgi:hypothetical protein
MIRADNSDSTYMQNFKARVTPLDLSMRRIRCDFNARGLGPEPDDSCFYSFDRDAVHDLDELVGKIVILYDFDSKNEVSACEATIERFETESSPVRNQVWFSGYRARPRADSWYWGITPW